MGAQVVIVCGMTGSQSANILFELILHNSCFAVKIGEIVNGNMTEIMQKLIRSFDNIGNMQS